MITLAKLKFFVFCVFFLHMHSAYSGHWEYSQGLDGEKNGDFPLAFKFYKKSSLKGNQEALDRMLSKEFHDINILFTRAQSKDEDLEPFSLEQRIEAQRSLALMFLYGQNGLPQDAQRAYYWLSEAAKNNDPESRSYLGL